MTNVRWLSVLVVAMSLGVGRGAAAAGPVHWPQWRGPDGDGTSKAVNLPVEWSDTKNVVWKVRVASWSAGSPVIWGDRIFVTSPAKADPNAPPPQRQGGRRRRGRDGRHPGGDTLMLLCLRKADGKRLWQRDLGAGNYFTMRHNMSSPSPVTDGKHVWVLTGTGVLAGFDMNGKPTWRRDLVKEYGPFGVMFGYASSPLLVDDKLVVEVIHGTNAKGPSYVLGVDRATGRNVWKVDRPTDAARMARDAYTTPALVTVDGRKEIVVSGGDCLTGHDPATGKELWRANTLNPTKSDRYRLCNSPVVVGDTIYVSARKTPTVAVRAGGKGDVSATHLLWTNRRGTDVPTSVSDGKRLYVLDGSGRMMALDTKTGENVWPDSARAAQGTYWASLLLADGKLYATSQTGTTTLMAAGTAFEILATNQLDDDYVLGSIAVSQDRLYLRGSKHLYCIGLGTETTARAAE